MKTSKLILPELHRKLTASSLFPLSVKTIQGSRQDFVQGFLLKLNYCFTKLVRDIGVVIAVKNDPLMLDGFNSIDWMFIPNCTIIDHIII